MWAQDRDGTAKQPRPGPRRPRILHTPHTRARTPANPFARRSRKALPQLFIHSLQGEAPLARVSPSRDRRGLKGRQMLHRAPSSAHSRLVLSTRTHNPADSRSFTTARVAPAASTRLPAAPQPRTAPPPRPAPLGLPCSDQPGTQPPPPGSTGNSQVSPPPGPRPGTGRGQGTKGGEEGRGGGEQKFRPLRARPRARLLPGPRPRSPSESRCICNSAWDPPPPSLGAALGQRPGAPSWSRGGVADAHVTAPGCA